MSDSSKPRSTGTEWALVQWFATTGGERVALLNLGGDFAVCKSYSHVAPPAFVQYPSEPEARRAYAAELVRGQRDYVIEYNAAEGE